MIIMMIMKQQVMIHDDDHADDDDDDADDEEEEEEECVCLVHFHQTTWAVHGCVLPVENNAVLPCIYDKEHVVANRISPHLNFKTIVQFTFPKTNIAPENKWCLGNNPFFFCLAFFQGQTGSFRG